MNTPLLERSRSVVGPRLVGWHQPLLIMVAAMLGLTLVASAGLLIDGRVLLNESIWLKPLKFSVSFVLYGLTLAWLLSQLDPERRAARRIAWWAGTGFAITGIIDVGFVALQAARGTYSHFNTEPDAINQIGQTVFQVGVMSLFVANLVLVVVLLLQRVGDVAFHRAVRIGLVLAVAGMVVAFMMAGQGGQHEVVDAYGRPVVLGASHSIGAPPDGAGIPILGWSASGGDLRVPHFFGMHAIHLLLALLIGLSLLAEKVSWLQSDRVRGRLVGIAALGCVIVFVLLTAQAANGQSVVSPGPTMVAMTASLVAGGGLAVGLVIRDARRAPRSGDDES